MAVVEKKTKSKLNFSCNKMKNLCQKSLGAVKLKLKCASSPNLFHLIVSPEKDKKIVPLMALKLCYCCLQSTAS